MAIVKTDNQYYTDIANAIRARNEESISYMPDQLAPALYAIFDGEYTSSIKVSTMPGASVTAFYGDITKSTTANSNGVATITECVVGDWSISSIYGTVSGSNTVSIDENDRYVSYSTSIPLAMSTLTISSNASCTIYCKYDGSTIYTTTGSSVTIDRLYPGTWTIEAVRSGIAKTQTLTVAQGTNSYTANFVFDIYTVAVYTTAGASVTMSMTGETTRTATANSSGVAYFYNCKSGTWSVSSSYGRGSGSGSVTITTTSGTTFSVTITLTFTPVASVRIRIYSVTHDWVALKINGTKVVGTVGKNAYYDYVFADFTNVPPGTWEVYAGTSSALNSLIGTITIPYDYSGSSIDLTVQ